jgi:hypothetical protein
MEVHMDMSEPRVERPAVRHFALAVWPQSAAQAWHAEVTPPGTAAPLHFERPIDLLLYLTEFAGAASPRPPGLR